MSSSSTSTPSPKPEVPKIIFIIGPPGAGKGTLSKLLVAQYPHIFHLSVGDYMRSCLVSGAFGTCKTMAALHLSSGTILPTGTILPLLKQKIEDETGKGWRYFLVDGFPRNLVQGGAFEREIAKPLLVINLWCPDHLAESRVLGRHILDRAPTDTEPIFRKRYHDYVSYNPGIVQVYTNNQLKLMTVDSSGEEAACYREMVEKIREREEGREFLDAGDGEGKGVEGW